MVKDIKNQITKIMLNSIIFYSETINDSYEWNLNNKKLQYYGIGHNNIIILFPNDKLITKILKDDLNIAV